MTQAVEDSGYQYDFIVPQQLAAGVLAEKGDKALLLPQVTCLSEEEIAAVGKFVEGGGAAAFDLPPGILDWHGRSRLQPPAWTGPNVIVRIPVIPATDSGGSRPPVPEQGGRV